MSIKWGEELVAASGETNNMGEDEVKGSGWENLNCFCVIKSSVRLHPVVIVVTLSAHLNSSNLTYQ